MSLVLNSSSGGSITINEPTTASNFTQTLVAVTETLAPIVSGTAVASTSGTSIDFTSIPSWVKRITVMLSGVSTNGTSIPQIQLGDAGGVEITGYAGYSYNPSTAATSATGATLAGQWSAASALYGSCTISLIGSNAWVVSFSGAATGLNTICACGYSKTLSNTLTQVRITTVNGTDTFDAGTINILYE
jgi:hypothetical protein